MVCHLSRRRQPKTSFQGSSVPLLTRGKLKKLRFDHRPGMLEPAQRAPSNVEAWGRYPYYSRGLLIITISWYTPRPIPSTKVPMLLCKLPFWRFSQPVLEGLFWAFPTAIPVSGRKPQPLLGNTEPCPQIAKEMHIVGDNTERSLPPELNDVYIYHPLGWFPGNGILPAGSSSQH